MVLADASFSGAAPEICDNNVFGLPGLLEADPRRSSTRTSCGFIVAGVFVDEGENLGLMLTRRWPAAVLAAVFVAALWSLVLAGPVLANNAGPVDTPAIVQTAAQAIAADTSVLQQNVQQATLEASAKHKTTRAATPKEAPDGSPFYVQAIMIVILLVLGVGYFKLMSHSGRRTPAAKVDPEKTDVADAKQPSDA